MLIDWVTVVAQIFNFLVLVWLLNRFLFQPVLVSLDQRNQKVFQQLEDAKLQKQKAELELKSLQSEKETFQKEKTALMNRAVFEAKAEKDRLLNEVRKEGDEFRAHIHETIRHEQRNLHNEIAHRVEDEIFNLSKKVLIDLSGMDIEERILSQFYARLSSLSEQERKRMKSAKVSFLRVMSSFPFSDAQKQEMEKTIHEIFPSSLPIRFETSPELIGGVELIAEGYKLSWSIAGYLEAYLQRSETQTII